MTSGGPGGRAQRIVALGWDYDAQPKTPVTRCNLCGADRFVGLTHRDRYGYRARADACTRCGLVFLNPVMTADAYRAFYDGTYRPLVSAYHGRRIDAETIQAEQAEYAAALGAVLAPYAARGGALLDVGGSTGVVAHHLARRFGLAATILDPAPLEIAAARRLGLETVIGLVEDFDPAGRVFDLVTLCQTVDHLLDVGGTLAKIRKLLAPAGVFFVDIVDFRAAYLRHWSVEEAVKVDHPYSLTEATLEAYLAVAGFAPLRKEYAADRLHVGWVCRPAPPAPEAWPPPAAVEALLREVRLVQNAPRPGAR
jgi:SAM-dependent methyltransferase